MWRITHDECINSIEYVRAPHTGVQANELLASCNRALIELHRSMGAMGIMMWAVRWWWVVVLLHHTGIVNYIVYYMYIIYMCRTSSIYQSIMNAQPERESWSLVSLLFLALLHACLTHTTTHTFFTEFLTKMSDVGTGIGILVLLRCCWFAPPVWLDSGEWQPAWQRATAAFSWFWLCRAVEQ